MALKVNSPDWEARRNPVSRGAAEAASGPLPGLPDDFLAEGTEVEDEVVLKPRPVARGAAAPAGVIDMTTTVGPGESAVLAIRHPSGALTFHPPAETVRPTRGGPAEVRFVVPPPAPPPESVSRGVVDMAAKAILVKVKEATIDKVAGVALPALARAF